MTVSNFLRFQALNSKIDITFDSVIFIITKTSTTEIVDK